MQRASYQRLNPNMSTHKTPTPKQACLAFKSPDGVIFKPVTPKAIRLISPELPSLSQSQILINLINGETLLVRHYQVTLVYR